MKFSLVVTCRNEMTSLPRWYEDVLAQTRLPDEIVLVDSESTDGTTEFLRDWERRDPRVRTIVQKCKPARGHNVGNAAATHDHIVSTDMGIRIDKSWFEEIVKPFEDDPRVEVVAGSSRLDFASLRGPVARAEYYIDDGGEHNLEAGYVPTNRSMAYTKTVWRELGGLPEDLTFYADDSVFGRQIVQAGYRMVYAPRAMTYWGRFRRLRDFCREQYNYGRGGGEARIKKPFVFGAYEKGRVPRLLVPLLHGLRIVQKGFHWTSVVSATKAGDFRALLVMPFLLFCRGYFFAKGYLVGDAYGKVHCRECRARLRRPDPALSIPE